MNDILQWNQTKSITNNREKSYPNSLQRNHIPIHYRSSNGTQMLRDPIFQLKLFLVGMLGKQRHVIYQQCQQRRLQYQWWMNNIWLWNSSGMTMRGEKWSNQKKPHLSATLCNTAHTDWPGMEPMPCSKKLVINCLSHCLVWWWEYLKTTL